MFDHEHGVAAIAQFAERGEQPLVVVRVQPDAGFVEHVDDTDEAHAQLRGEPHPLALAAGQRGVFAVECEVTKPGFAQKMQSLRHALQHLAHGVGRRQHGGQAAHEFQRPADIHGGERREAQTAQQHGGAAGVEPPAVARWAVIARHEGGQPRPVAVAARLAPAGVEQRNDSGKWFQLRFLRASQSETEQPLTCTVQERMPCLRWQILPRSLGVERQLRGQLLEEGVVADDEIPAADAPRLDGSLAHSLVRLGHDQLLAEDQLAAQSAAGFAGALGVIEGEMPRRERFKHVAADGAAQALAEMDLAPRRVGALLHEHQRTILTFAECQLQ